MSEMKDQVRGLYHKFIVRRVDGRDNKGEKHFGCKYFVLDLTHDKYAIPAILAYAKVCQKEFPLLSRDLKGISEGDGK